jgi:hypothetical protein
MLSDSAYTVRAGDPTGETLVKQLTTRHSLWVRVQADGDSVKAAKKQKRAASVAAKSCRSLC